MDVNQLPFFNEQYATLNISPKRIAQMRIRIFLGTLVLVTCALVIALPRDRGHGPSNEIPPATSTQIETIPFESDGQGNSNNRNAIAPLDPEDPATIEDVVATTDQIETASYPTFAGLFDVEDVEPTWAAQTEAELLTSIADSGIPANRVDAECRSTTCRLKLVNSTYAGNLIASTMDAIHELIKRGPSGLSGAIIETSGEETSLPTELTIYLQKDCDCGIAIVNPSLQIQSKDQNPVSIFPTPLRRSP